MEARNRPLSEWYNDIDRGKIKLPRFQRFEAWDRYRICSLFETVLNDLPLGITLVLQVHGNEEKFISRFLETAPEIDNQVFEHLLDGQQRLTALWRLFYNNYELEKYFVYLKEFDNYEGDEERDDLSVFCKTRYIKKSGEMYPLWCDDPAECLKRGFFPTDLFRPDLIQQQINQWVDQATAPSRPKQDVEQLEAFFDRKQQLSTRINELRSIIANYNLPFLSLPAQTSKSVALDVFIKMNTNSRPLSQYDVIVAEVESVKGQSLHDLQEALNEMHPEVSRYSELSDLILTTSALLQDSMPNQRGAWEMDKTVMVDNWEKMSDGLARMSDFLRREGIYDRQRLPTNAVLAVIAALYSFIPNSGDRLGFGEQLLKRYVWHAFFTDRYENAAATYAYADYLGLKSVLTREKNTDVSDMSDWNVPIFSNNPIVDEEELLTAEWPKRATIRGRGILAVTTRLGAQDFSTGEPLKSSNISKRHYHHIFPEALLKEADIDGNLALNCALITDKTNISIGRKDPLQYFKDRFEWSSEDVVRERLQSHLIPIAELANGGYEGLSDEAKNTKLRTDFHQFIKKRTSLVMNAAQYLIEGRRIPTSIHSD